MISKRMNAILKIILSIIISVVIGALVVPSIRSKTVWSDIKIIDLSLLDEMVTLKSIGKHVKILAINIHNESDEDADLSFLQAQNIENYFGITFKFSELFSSYNPGVLIKETSGTGLDSPLKFNFSGTKIPAKETLSIYIWAKNISVWPDVKVVTNKGSIEVRQEIVVSGRVKYFLYDSIWYLFSLFALAHVWFWISARKGSQNDR